MSTFLPPFSCQIVFPGLPTSIDKPCRPFAPNGLILPATSSATASSDEEVAVGGQGSIESNRSDAIKRNRLWLLSLIDAVSAENRDAILGKLKEVEKAMPRK